MPADCLTKWLPSDKLKRSVEYMTGARVAATANASEMIEVGAIESAIANVSDIGHGASAGANAHVSGHPQSSNRSADPVGGSVVGGDPTERGPEVSCHVSHVTRLPERLYSSVVSVGRPRE